tara:strand:- start:557 stop:745 length:189 start_codon:yes stop_codon:yes gene_type:complete
MAKLKMLAVNREALADNVRDLKDLEDVQIQLSAAGLGDDNIMASIRANLVKAQALLDVTEDF